MGYVDKVLLYTYENSNELSITNSKNERKIKELYKYKFFYCNKISNMEIRDKIARKLNIEYRIQKIFYSDKKNNILLYFKQFDKKNPYYSLKLIMKFIIKVFLNMINYIFLFLYIVFFVKMMTIIYGIYKKSFFSCMVVLEIIFIFCPDFLLFDISI